MIYVGIALLVLGFACTSLSGSLTKRYIRINNPEAFTYNATQMKVEWQRVAREGKVVPRWVSLISIGGWLVIVSGVVVVIWGLL